MDVGGDNRWFFCTLHLDVSITWLQWREPNLFGCCFEILESMLAAVTSSGDGRYNFIDHRFDIGLECSISWLSQFREWRHNVIVDCFKASLGAVLAGNHGCSWRRGDQPHRQFL